MAHAALIERPGFINKLGVIEETLAKKLIHHDSNHAAGLLHDQHPLSVMHQSALAEDEHLEIDDRQQIAA